MTDKDPKDMTVSELLRKAGNGYEGANGTVMMNLIDLMGLSRKIRHSECLYALADKIDAELAQARCEALRQGAELWAKANGWPDFREGEDFGAWLERCAIRIPCFEDGEPVQFGDSPVGLDGVEKFIFTRSCGGSCQMQDANGNMLTVFPGERVKRPAPEVLGADGLPLNEDDTVYGTGREQHRYTVQVPYSINEEVGKRFCVQCYDHDEGNITWCDPSMLTHERPVLGADGKPIVEGEKVYRTDNPITEAVVTGFRGYDDGSIDVVCSEKGGKVTAFYSPSLLTHTPPDTQQRIDQDALKSSYGYWGCSSVPCEECPSMIDGKRPCVRYQCEDSCLDAMKLDLLRRQRLLDGVEK